MQQQNSYNGKDGKREKRRDMNNQPDRKNLGRGLSTLLGELSLNSADGPVRGSTGNKPVATVPVERIRPNPEQPRQEFEPQALAELAASIMAGGIIQPIVVRPDQGTADSYIIVAGERRWRAAQQARLHEVPVVVRAYSDGESLQAALVENIQRSDLNAIEEAQACRQLIDKFGHTQEDLSKSLGKSRSAVANLLRLLTLPDEVQAMVREGVLSSGHARALIGSENPLALARQVVNLNLTVRQTEELAKKMAERSGDPVPRRGKDANTRVLEASLSSALNAKVSLDLSSSGEDGKMIVRFKDLEQLDQLCNLFNRAGADLRKEI